MCRFFERPGHFARQFYVPPFRPPTTLHFASTVYEDLCVFCSFSESVIHALVIRDVTCQKSRHTVEVMNVGVTLGVGHVARVDIT